MTRFSILPALALGTLSLLAAGTPASAGKRPIQVEGWGILSTYYESAPALQGPGEGDHLGQCSLYISLDGDELNNHGHLVLGYLLLEAANGDRLIAAVDSEFDPETGISAATITFTGGTGRFADATGSARLVIAPETSWFDYTGFPYPIGGTRFAWTLDGTIDY